MRLYKPAEIQAEDFSAEDQEMASRLGNIINPFMQQVVELVNGRLDFENRVEDLIQLEVSVDSTGKPLLNSRVNVGKTSSFGLQVISDVNLTNSALTLDSAPYISFSNIGNGLVEIRKITGLVPNNRYRLNIIVY